MYWRWYLECSSLCYHRTVARSIYIPAPIPHKHVTPSLLIIMPPMGDRGPSPLRPPNAFFRIESLISPNDREHHPVIHAGRVAVITGAASGIGRAAASELAR